MPTQPMTEGTGVFHRMIRVLSCCALCLSVPPSAVGSLGATMQENFKIYGAVDLRLPSESGEVVLRYSVARPPSVLRVNIYATYDDTKSVRESAQIPKGAYGGEADFLAMAALMAGKPGSVSGKETWLRVTDTTWLSGDLEAVVVLYEGGLGNNFLDVTTMEYQRKRWERQKANRGEAGTADKLIKAAIAAPKSLAEWGRLLCGRAPGEVKRLLGAPQATYSGDTEWNYHDLALHPVTDKASALEVYFDKAGRVEQLGILGSKHHACQGLKPASDRPPDEKRRAPGSR